MDKILTAPRLGWIFLTPIVDLIGSVGVVEPKRSTLGAPITGMSFNDGSAFGGGLK